jgi:response regulator RpfG family c-di-GMP phosphodiesterase
MRGRDDGGIGFRELTAMKSSDFNQVRVVLVENNQALRGDLRAALIAKGVRDIIACKSLKSFLDVAKQECLDLVVCESEALGAEFTDALQRIRRNDMEGGNPFVVVIATVHDASLNRVQAVLNGGVDDLLLKPVRVNRVVDRIDHLVRERKPFVVTNNYVGPTRRANIRSQRDDKTYLRVPNTLRSKVVDKVTQDRVRQMIERTVLDLKAKVILHPIARIDRLIQRVLAYGDGPARGDELRRDCIELTNASVEMHRQYAGSAFSHIADLAMALANLARRIADQGGAGLTQVELDLLANLGEVIRRSVAAETRSADVGHDVVAPVQAYADPRGMAEAAVLTKH